MGFKDFFRKVGKGVAWPVCKIDREIGEALAEKSALVTAAALAEMPILDDLLDGKPVDLQITIQMKRRA